MMSYDVCSSVPRLYHMPCGLAFCHYNRIPQTINCLKKGLFQLPVVEVLVYDCFLWLIMVCSDEAAAHLMTAVEKGEGADAPLSPLPSLSSNASLLTMGCSETFKMLYHLAWLSCGQVTLFHVFVPLLIPLSPSLSGRLPLTTFKIQGVISPSVFSMTVVANLWHACCSGLFAITESSKILPLMIQNLLFSGPYSKYQGNS